MGTYLALGLAFLALLGLLAWLRRREDKYLKKRTRDALRPALRKELEREKEDALRRKKAFEDSLKRFGP